MRIKPVSKRYQEFLSGIIQTIFVLMGVYLIMGMVFGLFKLWGLF